MSLAAVVAFKGAVVLLGTQAAGRFQVKGYQTQKKPAETIIDLPLVQCWIDSARVDWDRSSENGPKTHGVRVGVRFTAAQPAKGDLATLENPASSDAQRATALSNLTSPAPETTDALYDVWSAVFEILDDARNRFLGLPNHSIAGKRFSDFQQDEFPPRGGVGILTATSFLEFRVKEAQLGDIGTLIATMDNTLQGADIDENVDTVSKAGTLETYP